MINYQALEDEEGLCEKCKEELKRTYQSLEDEEGIAAVCAKCGKEIGYSEEYYLDYSPANGVHCEQCAEELKRINQ